MLRQIIETTRTQNTYVSGYKLTTLACLLVCACKVSAQLPVKNGNIVSWRDNTIELSLVKSDTTSIQDPVTGNWNTTVVTTTGEPTKLNGMPLSTNAEIAPVFKSNYKNLRNYLLMNMKEQLAKLNDGLYTLNISNIYIGADGRIIYFEYGELARAGLPGEPDPDPSKQIRRIRKYPYNQEQPSRTAAAGNGPARISIGNNPPAVLERIDIGLQQEIYSKVCDLMANAPAFIPGTTMGKNVACGFYDFSFWNYFLVNDHKVYDKENDDEYKEL